MSVALEIEHRGLGSPGLEVPRVALGCGSFGGIGSAPELFGQGLDEMQAFALMDAAWELGIRHFDTADAYGGGRSEAMIGRWIRSRGVRPQLTTKTCNPMSAGADRGLAPERVLRQLESSLERLEVDAVELYLAHDFDPLVPLYETFDAFEQLASEDKVRAYGVSNFDGVELLAALRSGWPPAAIQNAFSLLQREDEADVLPLCEASGVAYLAFGPLSGGWLTGKYRRGEPFPAGSRMTQRPEPYRRLESERTFDGLDALAEMAAHRGVSSAGLALAWLLADDRVAQIVVGPGRPEHLEPVREALADPLAPEDRERLARAFS